MSDQETRPEDICFHCKMKPARKLWSGPFSHKYCSLECNAIEYYRNYALTTCCFSVGFLLTIYGVFFVLIDEYPIDAGAILQILFFAFGFFYFGYATIVGYRGAKRERKSEDPTTPENKTYTTEDSYTNN